MLQASRFSRTLSLEMHFPSQSPRSSACPFRFPATAARFQQVLVATWADGLPAQLPARGLCQSPALLLTVLQLRRRLRTR